MAGRGSRCEINLEIFNKRLKTFYDHKARYWGSTDAVVFVIPPISDDIRYFQSHALNNWLFQRVFPNTIMIFMNREIHYICDQETASKLKVLKRNTNIAVGIEIFLHVGVTKMDEIIKVIGKSSSQGAPIVGYIEEEAVEGDLLRTWTEKLKGSSFQLVDVAYGFSELFVVKDETEQNNVKKAANNTSTVMKCTVIPMLQRYMKEKKIVPHSTLMASTEIAILEGREPVELKNFDICYPPIFQSGGKFDFRPTATSNDDNLFYGSKGVIICAFGSRYNGYCSNVARTILTDAHAWQIKAYTVLLEAQMAAIDELKVGNMACAVYGKAVAVVQKHGWDVSKLTDSAGMGIGLLLYESGLSLNGSNERILEAGMVFNVSLGFQNLQLHCGGWKTKEFSLLLADTVIVGKDGPQVLTDCPKAVEQCHLKEKKLLEEMESTGTSRPGEKRGKEDMDASRVPNNRGVPSRRGSICCYFSFDRHREQVYQSRSSS